MDKIEEVKQGMDQLVGEMRKTHEDLQKKIEKSEGGQSELKTMLEKQNADIDKKEEKNQELMKQIAEKAKGEDELKQQVKDLEAGLIKLKSSRGDSGPGSLGVEMKAAEEWAKSGELKSFGESERKSYLRSDNNEDGGFLMGESFDESIIKPITESSILRPVCRTKRISTLSEKFALRSALVTATWEGEGEAASNTNSTYAQPEIHVHKLDVSTKITRTALNGARFNMDSEILSDFAEAREQKEGSSFVVGDANKKPRGFLNASASVPTHTSATAATYDFDDLLTLTGKLKKGYRPIFAMNRTELAFMRTLKDGADAYIWREGNLGAGVPNAIAGEPYMVLPDMPDKGSLTTPVIYADFLKMYTIVDAFEAIMMRNPYLTGNDRGKVEFSLMSWVGGDVVMPEAGIILKCKTS